MNRLSIWNGKVISSAMSQIQTGVSQYIAYAEDIDTISTPMDRPVNTSTTGTKLILTIRLESIKALSPL